MTDFRLTAPKELATWLGIAAALLSLVLLAARIGGAISFETPLQVVTAGAEEESLLGIWKFANGMPIYADPHKIPFAASYYNWLYFVFYGSVSHLVLGLLSLGDAWLPTVARLTSLAISIGAAVLFFRSFMMLARPESRGLAALGVASSIYVAFGPLVGFWAIAAHPEMAALTCQIAAIHLFCKHYQSRRAAALLWFCLFAYLSWAFKQIYVYAPTALGLFLILRRDWRFLLWMCAIMAGAWALTIAVQDHIYLRMLFQIDTSIPMRLGQLTRNLANVAPKTLPFLLGFAALVAWWSTASGEFRRIRNEPYFDLLLIGTIVSAAIVIPASAKVGASESYYFPVIHFLALVLLVAVCRTEPPRVVVHALSLGWLASAAAIIAVLSGLTGVISTRDWHRQFLTGKACLDRLPKPAFTSEHYLALPWMNRGSPPFLLAYNYHQDRARGLPFERGGIGGLIGEGYFKALLFKNPIGAFDGADLGGFRRLSMSCDRYVAYVRKDMPMPRSDSANGRR